MALLLGSIALLILYTACFVSSRPSQQVTVPFAVASKGPFALSSEPSNIRVQDELYKSEFKRQEQPTEHVTIGCFLTLPPIPIPVQPRPLLSILFSTEH